MNIVTETNCPFCGTASKFWDVENSHNYFGFDCTICKSFFISSTALEKAKSNIGSQKNLNCISENINSNAAYGKEIVTSWHLESETKFPKKADNITIKKYETIAELPIIHAEKPSEFLILIAKKLSTLQPFEHTSISLANIYQLKIADFKEAWIWLSELKSQGLIDSPYFNIVKNTQQWRPTNSELDQFKVNITPKGWAKIDFSQSSFNSKRVFIAMQFKWEERLSETKIKFLQALKDGCSDCGYEANIVSQNHSDQITDRIVAEIKSSRFVIADFTYNNQGAYYEAGLARGLGKKVIHTVMRGHTSDKSDPLKRLHFDIQQINYLEWSDPKEVREKIRDRIKAVVEEE